jgi:hypothetical protein
MLELLLCCIEKSQPSAGIIFFLISPLVSGLFLHIPPAISFFLLDFPPTLFTLSPIPSTGHGITPNVN